MKNNKNVYIRPKQNGLAVTCTEHDKALFEQSKAKKILGNLPKTLRRLILEWNPYLILHKIRKLLEKMLIKEMDMSHLKILHIGLRNSDSEV